MSDPSKDREQLMRMLRTVRSDVPSIARDLDPDKLLSGQSRIGTIQFFERGRLELHGSPTGGSQVMGGRNVAELREIATGGPDRCQGGGRNHPQ